MVFQCINIRQVPWEVLKTATSGLGFQHLPRDLANVDVWKTMFYPYNLTQTKLCDAKTSPRVCCAMWDRPLKKDSKKAESKLTT